MTWRMLVVSLVWLLTRRRRAGLLDDATLTLPRRHHLWCPFCDRMRTPIGWEHRPNGPFAWVCEGCGADVLFAWRPDRG